MYININFIRVFRNAGMKVTSWNFTSHYSVAGKMKNITFINMLSLKIVSIILNFSCNSGGVES